jgi:peptidoglycan/LPS O-acetylase OafA/YrhL
MMRDRHLPQLDGLRGIAILIVLLGHLLTRSIGFGIEKLGALPPIGVDLFFVLSGFLITNVLLRAKSGDHFFTNFYARRALRIAPLYFALLIFMFAIANHRLAALTFNSQKVHWQVYAFYVQNLYYRQASELGPLALAVTWSLAVEEQFYMVWPLLVSRLTTSHLSAVAAGLIFIAPVARIVVPAFGYDPYINPLCRMDAMGMGALLSLWLWQANPSTRQIKSKAVSILAAGLAAEIICHFLGLSHILSKSFVALMFMAVVALSLAWEPLAKVLSIAPLRLTGKVSYCLYLAHPIVGGLIHHEVNGSGLAARAARSSLTFVLSYAVAFLSWTFFESPILSLKKYFTSHGPPKHHFPSDDLNSAALIALPGVD